MTQPWQFTTLQQAWDERAPDGTEVRKLLRTSRASSAHFRLGAGSVSMAVAHVEVEELWYVLSGTGELWLAQGGDDQLIHLEPGVAVAIPAGVRFQMRAASGADLDVLGVTMPPWPGDHEAVPCSGQWENTST